MVKGKMCVSVSGNELMCRIDPDLTEDILENNDTRPMMREGKMMKGFVYIGAANFRSGKELSSWVKLCLDFNKRAKATRKKK